MIKISASIVAISLISLFCIALLSFRHTKTNCGSVKNGTFHFYQNNGQYHSIVMRKDSLQTEINTNTGDTSYWRVAWTSDCNFTIAYISGSKVKSQQELDFHRQSTLKFSITNTTKDYYTYNALFTYNNDSKKFSDTMWFHEKK